MKRCFFSLLVASQIVFADEKLMNDEIQHVVVLMMENRSFDNVLGWLYDQDLPENFIPVNSDPVFKGLTGEDLESYANVLRNSKGEIVYSCAPIKGLPSAQDTLLINSPKFDPNEPFENVAVQVYNGGNEPTMSGFLQDYATLWVESEWLDQKTDICAVMETYTKEDLPILNALARHYAVSDYYFSSVPTQTNPNRSFSICGTSDGQINNGFLGKNTFTSDTIWNRLYEESPDTTWTVFWQSDFIPFIFPGPYTGPNLFSSVYRIPNWSHHYKKLDEFHTLARKGALPDISYLEPQWTLSLNLSQKENDIFSLIYNGDEFILGFQGNDYHPPGDIRAAENLLANVYTSLISNEEAWQKTLLIILFDEHGGLFDHLPPPTAISPDNCNQEGFNFDRYGVRVPALFISPRIAKGTVIRSSDDTIPFDHTSLIATLLKWKNVDRSKWNMGNRVAIAPTFDSVITLQTPRSDNLLTDIPTESASPVIQIGERFFIKDIDGHYFARTELNTPCMGTKEDRIAFKFVGGTGQALNGSFVLLEACDPSLNHSNFLETSLTSPDCVFTSNTQDPKQWWTLKNASDPCIGAELHYGDKIYFENHTYLELVQYVPCRLSKDPGLLETYIKAVPITDTSAETSYWILEKE